LQTIFQSKGFTCGVYGSSTAFSKGEKTTCRIVIIPKRILDGEVGLPPGRNTIPDPDHPGQFLSIINPLTSVNMHFDIHLVSNGQKQSRFLNAILQRAFGQMKYIPFYDKPGERLFIKYYNYYDVSDTNDSTEENVYSYEVQDLYLLDYSTTTVDPGGGTLPISPILEIDTGFIMGYRVIPPTIEGGEELLEPEYPNDDPNTLKVGDIPPP